MYWVVQENIYQERRYDDFLRALQVLKVEHQVVKVVPFANKLLPAGAVPKNGLAIDELPEPYVDTSKDVIVFGSITLGKLALQRGWKPGVFLNENFDFRIWSERYGFENVLNGDSVTGKVCNISVPEEWKWVFLRPVLDDKAFAGTVLSKSDFDGWLLKNSDTEESEFTPLHRNTSIAVAPAKNIQQEYRLFCVEGEVVTGSLYKQDGKELRKEFDELESPEVSRFANSMIEKWRPAVAFVIDIAVTIMGPKIIEINSINSAGFYEANPQQIVMAIEELNLVSTH